MSNKTKDFSMSPFQAIVCGDSQPDRIRLAATLANDQTWDEVIIVGDSLYDLQNARIVKKPSELPPVNSFCCTKRTLVIFDRCDLNADKTVIHVFSVLGRMHGVSILFVLRRLAHIPKYVNLDILYFTSAPPSWTPIKMRLNISQSTEDLAGQWFKIDLRQRCRKIETVD